MGGLYKLLGSKKDLRLGDNCSFTREPWPFLDVKGGGIVMGDNVVVSSGVYILTHEHQFNKSDWRNLPEILSPDPTVICDNVFLGVNCIILPSCKRIGVNSVIGAGSIVTRDVPDNEIWAGNPASCIGIVEKTS